MFSMLLCIWRFFRLVKPLVDHTPNQRKTPASKTGGCNETLMAWPKSEDPS
jgi:hypothetical protein